LTFGTIVGVMVCDILNTMTSFEPVVVNQYAIISSSQGRLYVLDQEIDSENSLIESDGAASSAAS
jgi:hypothetical protein